MNFEDDIKTLDVYGTFGRDAGKKFVLTEIDPLTLSGLVLRLVSSLRVSSYEELLIKLSAKPDPDEEVDNGLGGRGSAIDAIMQLLQGADPKAVHSLIHDLLAYVKISPDPQHPGVLRALVNGDIKELRTLGEILMATGKLNFNLGG